MSARVRSAALAAALALAAATPLASQEPAGRRIQLTRDTVIATVHCGPTGRAFAVLHPNGALDECPLARDEVLDGVALPRGTWIRLRPDASLDGAWLPRDVLLQGIPCKGTGYKGWAVRFHPGGRLALCYLSRETTIDGVRCRAGSFLTELSGSTQVTLHPNGRLVRCRPRR